LACAVSCISIDENIGRGFTPEGHWFSVGTVSFPLVATESVAPDSLSGFNSYLMALGSVRDSKFGLARRSTAFTLVPTTDSLDFGENRRVRGFHFTAVKNSLSVPQDGQERILQNVNVYALKKPITDSTYYSNALTNEDFKDELRITKGIPVYNGGDSLSFDFTEEFAKEYMSVTQEELDSLNKYTKRFPGIYICTDDPVGSGGRINIFDIAVQVNSEYYVTGNYAELKITADYGSRKDVDTSFLYYFGPAVKGTTGQQYAMNLCEQEESIMREEDEILVEGGTGLKPVISSKEIRDSIYAKLASKGISPSSVIINKASIVLPFTFPADYEMMDAYPEYLSPTTRIRYTDANGNRQVTYVGLTDSSSSTENQGDVDRSICQYAPDISHHVQNIIGLGDDADFSIYDIWMLIMKEETVSTTDMSSSSSMDDYYQNLAYANYYNNMYYGGYGGYGYGYGGYGYGYNDYYGYNNYYNYLMMAQMYSSSSSSTTTSTSILLDSYRYYKCVLNGNSTGNGPRMDIIFSYLE
ncbi:MAG: hypothetical protein ACI4TM_08050, partial [Candidatus Cryptobacteroides sp.]